MLTRFKLKGFTPSFHLFVIGFWYLIRFPGLAHTDTSVQLGLIRNGQVTNQWTIAWFLILKVLSLNAFTLAIICLLQLVATYLTLKVVAQEFSNFFPKANKALTIFICTPFFGYTATTVNHDLFAALGTLILLIELINYFIKGLSPRTYRLLVAILLSSVTYGAIFVAFFSIGLLLISEKKLRHFMMFSTLCLIILLNFSYPGNISRGESVITLISDIKCALEDPKVNISKSDLDSLEKLSSSAYWRETQSFPCTSSIQVFSGLKSTILQPRSIIPLWVRVGINNPNSYIMAHMSRSSFILPPPFSFKPSEVIDLNSSNLYLKHNIEFLTMDRSVTNQQIPGLGIIRNLSDFWAQILNSLTGWISWAGFWLPLTIWVYVKRIKVAIKSVRFRRVLFAFSPLIVLHVFLFFNAPGPEARHVLATILLGFIVLFSQILEFWERTFDS